MKERVPVLLVQMPFALLVTPSLGLSLFKANLTEQGILSRILYLNFRFARCMGANRYSSIMDGLISGRRNLIGEWIFSGSVFDQSDEAVEEYLDWVEKSEGDLSKNCDQPDLPKLRRFLLEVRGKVDSFLDDCVEEIARCRPRIAAFSSMFDQHLPSLGLARRLKERLPEVFVVFGGVNCEKIKGIETLKVFPYVDAVVSGEGEFVFPQLVRAVLEEREIPPMDGVSLQGGSPPAGATAEYGDAPQQHDLDALPTPDFHDYFAEVEQVGMEPPLEPVLLLETSRGCWWRCKKGCHFCSLNLQGSAYRVKSIRRALEEIRQVVERYPVRTIQMTDTVLPPSYAEEFFPELKKAKTGVRFFYEVRAHLTREQLRTMRESGVTCLQPGIESLSNRILALMNKGTTMLLNLQMLKWCREFGIDATWYILWGFPAEPPEEYARMTALLPLLSHLQPPSAFSRIYVGRYSNYHDHAAAFGFKNIRPAEAYRYIYPLEEGSVERLVQYFDYEYASPQDPSTYIAPLARAIREWRNAHRSSALVFVDDPVRPFVWDTRPCASNRLTVLNTLQRDILHACEAQADIGGIRDFLRRKGGEDFPETLVLKELESFIAQGLVIRDGKKVLGLAVSIGPERREAVLRHIEATLAREAAETDWGKLKRKVRLGDTDRDVRVTSKEIKNTIRKLDIPQ